MTLEEQALKDYTYITNKNTVFPNWVLVIVMILAFLAMLISRYFGIIAGLTFMELAKRQGYKQGYIDGYVDAKESLFELNEEDTQQ